MSVSGIGRGSMANIWKERRGLFSGQVCGLDPSEDVPDMIPLIKIASAAKGRLSDCWGGLIRTRAVIPLSSLHVWGIEVPVLGTSVSLLTAPNSNGDSTVTEETDARTCASARIRDWACTSSISSSSSVVTSLPSASRRAERQHQREYLMKLAIRLTPSSSTIGDLRHGLVIDSWMYP
jgi:hypothetical protein